MVFLSPLVRRRRLVPADGAPVLTATHREYEQFAWADLIR